MQHKNIFVRNSVAKHSGRRNAYGLPLVSGDVQPGPASIAQIQRCQSLTVTVIR